MHNRQSRRVNLALLHDSFKPGFAEVVRPTEQWVWGDGGGLYTTGPVASDIRNSIIWGNTAEADGPQLHVLSPGEACITSSNVEGGFTGLGNIDADPLFILPGFWEDQWNPG